MSKKKKFPELEQFCKQQFAYLESEYGFRFIGTEWETWGFEQAYISDNAGVTVKFEIPDSYIFVRVFRLVNGELCEDERIGPHTEINTMDLDNIVLLRSKESVPELDDRVNIDRLVRKQAFNLKTFASDFLQGDFRLFPVFEKDVREFARKVHIDEFGKDAARKMGWTVDEQSE